MRVTRAQIISTALGASLACERSGNTEWLGRWDSLLDEVERELPRGSGIDAGTRIDRDPHRFKGIIDVGRDFLLTGSWHGMDEAGGYAGWLDYTVQVTATFTGPSVLVGFGSAGDTFDVREYLVDVYQQAMSELVEEEEYRV